jgi:hypothetical protein
MVMNVMGHTDVRTAKRCQHPVLDSVREAIDQRNLRHKAIAMLAMRVMPFEPATPFPRIEGEGTVKAKQYRLPEWSLLAYGVIFSLGCNWECVFL